MSNSTELLERALEELYSAYRGKRHFPAIFLDIHKYLGLEPDKNIDISVVDDATHIAMAKYLMGNKEGLCHWSFARGVLWAMERARDNKASCEHGWVGAGARPSLYRCIYCGKLEKNNDHQI